MSTTPIADLALLSDCHSAALVNRDGCVEWLCFPRFDSPAVFARLLDDDAGHWTVRPIGAGHEVSRRYLDRTMVLETTFRTSTGVVVLTDALAMGAHNTGHQLGAGAPHLLLRQLRCTEGEAEIEVSYTPRPEFGHVVPRLSNVDGGITARGGAEWLVLTCPFELEYDRAGARGRTGLRAGETLRFALHRSTLQDSPARVWSQGELGERLEGTVTAWRSWADEHQQYDGPWDHLVKHSGRVLQALTYQPSGAIVAAATTSLPEAVGADRNWDYRYSWVRDASMTMEALWVAACPDEADDFFGFMTTAAAGSGGPERTLRIVYGVGGEHDISERTLDHLDGWRGSQPVRVGNDAWKQDQLDVYGELLGAAHRLADQLDDLDSDTRGFLVRTADAAATRWRDPDQGIWEVRGEPKQFLHSKVMCWLALDRAIELAELLQAAEKVPQWTKVREEIKETVLAKGWNEEAGSFTQHFGSTALDASSLVLPIVGFLPADDERMRATIETIADRLSDERGLIYRYSAEDGDDGVGGKEGTFLLCTFWLAEALALAGEVDRARTAFETAAAFANDVGLLAEEVDSDSGELLGNFPQAFSHVGLINAAWAISRAESQHEDLPSKA